MADAHFEVPRLAEIYDPLDPGRADLDAYAALRFRGRAELGNSLAVAGLIVDEVRDAPDRPGLEFVFIARKAA